jgi:hypothetical protein
MPSVVTLNVVAPYKRITKTEKSNGGAVKSLKMFRIPRAQEKPALAKNNWVVSPKT